MDSTKRLPDSELELMMIIWEAGQPVTSSYIMDKLYGRRSWAHTTVFKLSVPIGGTRIPGDIATGPIQLLPPLVAERDYRQQESKSFLKKMHRSSVTNLVASLYDGDALSQEDLEELKRFLEGVTES